MIPRTLGPALLRAFRKHPVVGIVGPRQSGKSTLARATFPELPYVNLERPDQRAYAVDDPMGFLGRFPDGALIDEIQRAPELPSYIQVLVDERGRPGQFVLTGSQNFLVMERFSQSLAGRIVLFRLLPFSLAELGGGALSRGLFQTLHTGFYPRIHDQELDPTEWLESYVETYVQRDVRTLRDVGDLHAFGLFLMLCAGRAATVLNLSSLAADAGIAVNTAKAWLSVLEASFVVHLLQPHHQSWNKRLVKAPKLHFVDVGLAAYLLGIRSADDLETHAKRGDLFESFVVGEIVKERHHRPGRWDLFYWRDKAGHELDGLVDLGGRLVPLEVKSGQTVRRDFFRNVDYYLGLAGPQSRGLLVHGGDDDQVRSRCEVRSWRALADPPALLAGAAGLDRAALVSG